MDYPGLDLKAMSDDELLKRLSDLNSKIVFVYSTSNNGQLLGTLQAMAETIQFEMSYRAEMKSWDKSKDLYRPIETDPIGSQVSKKPESSKASKAPANIFMPKRSKTPTSE